MTESVHALLEYHQRSKHHVGRYAPGPRGLDWDTQPDPFREFHGAAQIRMPLAADSLPTRYNDLRCGIVPSSQSLTVGDLGILFELSLGLSA